MHNCHSNASLLNRGCDNKIAPAWHSLPHRPRRAQVTGVSDFYKSTPPSDVKFCLNDHFEITGYVSLKDRVTVDAPNYLPENILAAFDEAATCFAVQCWNASASMLRLCIDLATK